MIVVDLMWIQDVGGVNNIQSGKIKKKTANAKQNLRVKQEHVDAHELATSADVSGLPELDGGRGATGLEIREGNQNVSHSTVFF
ncbi:hypothetical protein F2Q70_00022850 [Brassica cretica]|uniref:Uncharacterized protein n=1 Tax=Brassica cretica TaxID=69181 RepID=A0A8S9GI58_BRACR|nr:hypothetical protein F2Q70_00022850 [Brassica cretica]